jgi:hypothetical protein
MRSPGRKPNPIKIGFVGSYVDEDSIIDLVEGRLLRDMREVKAIIAEHAPKPEPQQPDPTELKRLAILEQMRALEMELEEISGGLSSTKTRPNL